MKNLQNESQKKYLEYIQDNYDSFKADEETACYVLAKNAGNKINTISKLILNSSDRFRTKYPDFYAYNDKNTCYRICYSLIVIGSKREIVYALKDLKSLEENNHPYEDDFSNLQELINTKTKFGFVYNHLDTKEKRDQMHYKFLETLKSSKFSNGVFIK